MADATLDVTAGSGTHLDVESLTVSALTVLRERNRLAGLGATELAAVRLVDATPGDGALVVRPHINKTFEASSTTTISSGTAGATTISLGYVFHASGTSVLYRMRRIFVSWAGGIGGDPAVLSIRRITAENGTPGGTSLTAAMYDPAGSTSATVVVGATGAPTRTGGNYGAVVCDLSLPGSVEWTFERPRGGQDLIMRASTAEGYELQLITGTNGPTTAAALVPQFVWTEDN